MRNSSNFEMFASLTQGRSLALNAISVIVISVASTAAAETETKEDLGHIISVVPDMSERQLTDLKSRLDSFSSGGADRGIITEFMRQNSGHLVARYDAKDKIFESKHQIETGRVKEVMDAMPDLLQRCRAEKKTAEIYVMRASFSWGAASVHCNAFKWSDSYWASAHNSKENPEEE